MIDHIDLGGGGGTTWSGEYYIDTCISDESIAHLTLDSFLIRLL